VDFKGRMCTLYPLSWQGAVFPPSRPIPCDLAPAVATFEGDLVKALRAGGLDPRLPVAGSPDIGIVVRPQVVLVDPGAPIQPANMFSQENRVVFEIEGRFGDASGSSGRFHALAATQGSLARQDPQALVVRAAGKAAKKVAKQILGRSAPGAISGAGGGPYPQMSLLQWQAYVRVRLFDGWPVERVLGELAAAGVDFQTARHCVTETRGIMIRRLVSYFIWGLIMILIGALAVVGAAANMQKTGRQNYLIMMGALVPFGCVYLYHGWLLLSRLPRIPRI
jgi:hypothetical protein